MTQRGIDNGLMSSLMKSPRRRKCSTKKLALAMTNSVPQASRKRALEAYQEQLVARPTILVSNSFSTHRMVAKNSAISQLR
jgi:hypothetical protein